MQDWLSAQAYAQPASLALICDGQMLSYGELDACVARSAAWLAGQGVQRGQRVALLPANDIPSVIAIHAIARLGATLVLINTRLTDGEIDAQLQRVRPSVVLRAGEISQMTDAQATSAATPSVKSGQIDLGDDACILFTSGTSGLAKAAVLTWSNFWHSALASAYRIGTSPVDRWLCILPLFHVGGLSILLRACLYGITVDLRPRFAAGAIHASLTRDPVTLVSLVPTMLHRLLDEHARQPARYPALRLVLLGGAAATPDLMGRASAAGIPIATTYGLTEAASQVCTALSDQAARKPAGVGRPLLLTELRIVDEHGRAAPVGEVGEVIVRGPTVMRGYLDDEESTQHAIQDGWLHTGDMGQLDGDGDLTIVQRRSDLIISGGENVYPAEVEAVLRQHPAVSECLVVGVDSAEWGQGVAALIVVQAPVDHRTLIDFVRARLAGYKVPRTVAIVDTLPLTASGKPDQAAARRVFTTQATQAGVGGVVA